MNIRFWAPAAPNVNKQTLSKGYRGKTKGELLGSFQEAGFAGDTWVLLIDRKSNPDKPISVPTKFSEIQSDAVYSGRANHLSGVLPRGILHAFTVR